MKNMEQQYKYFAFISYNSRDTEWGKRVHVVSHHVHASLGKRHHFYALRRGRCKIDEITIIKNKSKMVMKRIYWLIIVLMTSVAMSAQTQQGYVKTLGRPEKAGVPLGGVTVRVKGVHNTVLSKEDGTFSMTLTGKKNGDAYALQQVQKSGYELNEKEVIGRQYAFSDKVPLTIVMVSMAQLQADKQRISNNAFRVAERNYKAKMAMLEKQRDEHAISMEKYREDIRNLQDKFEKYQSMIDGLAEHYAHTDYDELDEKDREINICIENGDLERADSLIHLLFDPIDVLKRNKEALAKIEQQEVQAHDMIAQANADMAAVMKQQEKDAEYLYQLYSIALSRFDNDKAGFYIETRAELDPNNAEWQLNAGGFLNYIASYKTSLKYYYRAISLLESHNSESSYQLAICYNNIGLVYSHQGKYQEAQNYLKLAHKLHEKDSLRHLGLEFVVNLNNIAEVYKQTGDFTEAIVHHKEAVARFNDILKSHISDSSFVFAPRTMEILWNTYINWAEIERTLKHYDSAIKLLTDMQNNYHFASIGDNPIYARSLNNLGMAYYEKGDTLNAMKCYKHSLSIYTKLYSGGHPILGTLYNNMGEIYRTGGSANLALEFHTKALETRELFLGEIHPLVAQSHNNIGLALNDLMRYNEALTCFERALGIYNNVQSKNDEDIANAYNNKGITHFHLQDYDNAKDCLLLAFKAMENTASINYVLLATIAGNLYIINNSLENRIDAAKYRKIKLLYYEKMIQTNNHYNTDFYRTELASEYFLLGKQYLELEDYANALSCYHKAEKGVTENVLPKVYNDIALSYKKMNEFDNAGSYYRKALKLEQELSPKGSELMALIYNNIGGLYIEIENSEKAIDYLNTALEMFRCFDNEQSEYIAMVYANLGDVFDFMNNNEMALSYIQKACDIYTKLHNDQHPDVAWCYNKIAAIFIKQNQEEKGKDYLEKAYTINLRHYGKTHSKIADYYMTLGTISLNTNKNEEAYKHILSALSIYKPLYGENHSSIASCYTSLGLILMHNKPKEAEEYIKKALNIYTSLFGENSSGVARCYCFLGTLYLTVFNNTEESEKYIDKAIGIMEALYPNGHSDLCKYYIFQGACRIGKMTKGISSNRKDKYLDDYGAESSFEKALQMIEKYCKDKDDGIQNIVNNLLNIYLIKMAFNAKVSLDNSEYNEKLNALSLKYPQHVKTAMEKMRQ